MNYIPMALSAGRQVSGDGVRHIKHQTPNTTKNTKQKTLNNKTSNIKQ